MTDPFVPSATSCQAPSGDGVRCRRFARLWRGTGPQPDSRTPRRRGPRHGSGRSVTPPRRSARALQDRCRRWPWIGPHTIRAARGPSARGRCRPGGSREPRARRRAARALCRLVGVDRALDRDRQRLAGELVDDVEKLEFAAVCGGIVLKVHRPEVARVGRAQALGTRGGQDAESGALALSLMARANPRERFVSWSRNGWRPIHDRVGSGA